MTWRFTSTINNEIEEPRCPLEMSIALKEKGFKVVIFGSFNEIDSQNPNRITQIQYRVLNPTHAMANRWLMTNYGLMVVVTPSMGMAVDLQSFTPGTFSFAYQILSCWEEGFSRGFNQEIITRSGFVHPDGAMEAGLWYIIQNLIA